MIKQVIHGVFLDDLALLHHNDPVTALVDDVEIVRDEEVAQVVLPAQAHEQVEDLVLNGHVQGGHGLIQNDQLRADDHGRGDGDALALPAGELAGLAVVKLRSESHGFQHLLCPFPAFRRGMLAVDAQGLLDDAADGEGRVQGGIGVLKDHLGPLGVVDDLALVLGHAQDGLGQGGLAAAGLPHQTQDFAPADGDVDIPQDLDDAALGKGPAALPVKAVEVFDL